MPNIRSRPTVRPAFPHVICFALLACGDPAGPDPDGGSPNRDAAAPRDGSVTRDGGPSEAGGPSEDGGAVLPPADAGVIVLGPLGSARVPSAGVGGAGYVDHGCSSGDVPAGYSARYVSTSGQDSGTRGGRATPYRTLQAATEDLADPVVLCVASGTYTENVDLGTNRRVALVGGFDEDFATRDPREQPTRIIAAAVTLDAIRAEAPRELLVDGVEVSGSQRRGLAVNGWSGEQVRVLNVHVHHNGTVANVGAAAATGGISLPGGSDVSVELAYSVVEENDGWHHGAGVNVGGGGDDANPVTRDGAHDGFGSMPSAVAGLASIHHVVIRNNRLHETSLPHGAGLAVGANADVHHVEFVGNDTVGVDHYGVGGGMIAQHGVSNDDSASVVLVHECWFEANRAEKAGAALFFDQTSVGWVANCVFAHNVGEGTLLVDGACGDSCAGPSGNYDRNFVTAVFNTFVENEGAGLAVQDSTAHLYGNVFWHDASASGDVRLMTGSPGATNFVRGDSNVIVIGAGVTTELTNSLSAETDVPFEDVAGEDYRLRAGTLGFERIASTYAPAFAAPGVFARSSTPPLDFASAARPAGGPFVFGAFATRAP